MDLVVTVPKHFWLEWIAEGDAAGEPETGEEWGFICGRGKPSIEPGERLYVVAWYRLRGYALVTRVVKGPVRYNLYGIWQPWVICRGGGAVAVTLPPEWPMPGFRGTRKRWWNYSQERPFPDWKTAGIPLHELEKMHRKRAAGAEVRP